MGRKRMRMRMAQGEEPHLAMAGRRRGRKEGAVSPPVKKKGGPGSGEQAALQLRASLKSMPRAPRRRRARKSQVAPHLSLQIQIRKKARYTHRPESPQYLLIKNVPIRCRGSP